MNQAEKEVLISFLISQGQTRVRAVELVDEDPAGVQAEKARVESASQSK